MIRPWSEIRFSYKRLVEAGYLAGSMVAFVEKIEASRYVNGLYAWISIYDLCVVQIPVKYPYDGPYLRIRPLFDGNIDFRFIDTTIEERQWHRLVREEDAFSRLESFIEQLHWFTPAKQ
jgi:hypothetical protein